ncbi:MAG: serine/threonine-protein phosphatase [Chloroflexi bacterium]|nr:serine/threonine-protein phosphatase [Chloroflexota bacterium]
MSPLFTGVLHQPTGRLTYIRAAQERPLLYRPGLGIQELPANGRFLGMFDELTLVEDSVTLQAGDRLIIFSDGVPDSINSQDERFGYQRLHEAIQENGQLPCRHLLDQIVTAWRYGHKTQTHLTILPCWW